MTNRERLEDAGLLKSGDDLTQEQCDAIDSLTNEEVDALVSVRTKLVDAFPDKANETMILNVHRMVD